MNFSSSPCKSDLNIFLEAYWENKLEMQEWQCEYTRINECGCDDDDGKDDNFNEESCQYACFMDRGMDYCWEGGDYQNDLQMPLQGHLPATLRQLQPNNEPRHWDPQNEASFRV
mmetsp:Transcript_1571/g.1973  ORF Transcript_1571/g.1973 Transcript_1571/m.1973 type:complete len:114 (+) Transcript_1571:602-943(+)